MTNVAIIPARGGSKGIANKNLQSLGGQSLISRTILATREASSVDLVVVTSDSEEILLEAKMCGAIPILRPDDLASDSASTDPVIEHALNIINNQKIEVNIAILLQCTSAFTNPSEIDTVVNALICGQDQYDAAFAASYFHSFIWSKDESSGKFYGVNHNSSIPRARRQDIVQEQFKELGSVYAFYKTSFDKYKNRFCSCPLPVRVDSLNSYLEIDSFQDLQVARKLCSIINLSDQSIPSFAHIDTLVMDFDGVFTNNKSVTYSDGSESVYCSKLDSLGIAILKRLGINLLVITSELHDSVKKRLEKLRIQFIQTSEDKAIVLSDYMNKNNIMRENICYIGNDTNDNSAANIVSIFATPSDASESTINIAHYVSPYSGGNGCIRDICDKIISTRINYCD